MSQQEQLPHQMEELRLEGKQYIKDITTMLATLKKYQDKTQYGITVDDTWTPIENPSAGGEERYRKTKLKAVRTVKTQLTYIAADLTKLARSMDTVQKATYCHAIVKRRRRELASAERVRLMNKKANAEQARADKAKLAPTPIPSLDALLAEDDDDDWPDLPDLS